MIVSWQLLERFVSVPASTEEAALRLTMSGAEVESIEKPGERITGVTVARVASLEKHPTKGTLFVANLVTENTGEGKAVCVTAATNLKAGDKVFYGAPGAVIPDAGNKEKYIELGVRDFDGVRSEGMMLSGAELGLPDVDIADGILVLPEDAPLGADARTLYGIGDTLLDVSITPNRGDLLSILGIARELNGLYPEAALKTMPWESTPKDNTGDKKWPFEFGEISLPDTGCLNYHLGLALDAAIAPSPLEVRVALSHLGMRPISNVVDATNYVMLALGQPLHAFDLNTLPKREITVRSAADGEKIITLDGKERVLTVQDMLITSGGEPIALAGVMGGSQTGIADDTKIVVLESANFAARRVGHTSRRLGIASEAAFRYSRGVDPTLSATAIDYALMLMNEWAGAKIGYRKNSAFNALPKIEPVILTKKKLHTYLLWSDLQESTKILEGFGMRYTEDNNEYKFGSEILAFVPPAWRPDISIEEDLIEEIGRYRGYNEAPDLLPGELPRPATAGEATSLAEGLRACAIARGYVEAITYSFLSPSFVSDLHLPPDDKRARPLSLANPISQDWTAMRTTLLPGLLNGLKESITSGWRGPVRLFEIGRVFMAEGELDAIGGLVCGGVDPRTPWADAKEDFLSVKGDVEALLHISGRGFAIERGSEPFGHAGQTASVMVRGEKVGYIVHLSPAIEREYGFAEPVYAFEANLSALGGTVKPKYVPASPFPAVFRDISMLAPSDASHDDVIAEIRALALERLASERCAPGGFLESVKLFDVYSGKGVPEGRRSMAFSLCYRAPDRTLNDEEVDRIHNSIRNALTQKGYNMR